MDLKEYCYSLSKNDLLKLAIHVCEKSLFIWDEYCQSNILEYRDSVVGLRHKVRKELLEDSINCSRNYISFKRFVSYNSLEYLLEEFTDPIVSIQDFDWELPYPAEHVFYAVHNLLDGLKKEKTIFNELTHYVTVNQAVDALSTDGTLTTDEIRNIVYSTID